MPTRGPRTAPAIHTLLFLLWDPVSAGRVLSAVDSVIVDGAFVDAVLKPVDGGTSVGSVDDNVVVDGVVDAGSSR
jgi:hypothetical protein